MSITVKSSKGLVFTSDLMIAFLAMLIMLMISLVFASQTLEKEKSFFEQNQAEKKALILLDHLIKNSSDQNGLAVFDNNKNRVLENMIEAGKLETVNEKWRPLGFELFLQSFEEGFSSISAPEKACLVFRRPVTVHGTEEKMFLGVKACEK